jgi:hypothetical protein
MSRREIVAILAVLVAGFIAFEVLRDPGVESPDELAPGETPEVVAEAPVNGGGARQMAALVPAVLASELVAALEAMSDRPVVLPQGAGKLALAGSPGEMYFTIHRDGRAEVCVWRPEGHETIWSTDSDRILEIVGSHGSELLLKFFDRPPAGPAAGWQPGGFYRLDVLAPTAGIYPADIGPETVEAIRKTIRR